MSFKQFLEESFKDFLVDAAKKAYEEILREFGFRYECKWSSHLGKDKPVYVRSNEKITITPDGAWVYIGTENHTFQKGNTPNDLRGFLGRI